MNESIQHIVDSTENIDFEQCDNKKIWGAFEKSYFYGRWVIYSGV